MEKSSAPVPQPPRDFHFGQRLWHCAETCRIMGIINVTPDSFSDGGRFTATEAAVTHGLELVQLGADVLDIGGESTRPGAPDVSETEELSRVLPVIRGLRAACSVPLSIDTTKAAVAEAAVAAGADIINDVSGLHRDPRMVAVLRDSRAGGILMHMRGTPGTMRSLTDYQDLVGEIVAFFEAALTAAAAWGVPRERFMLDPGIGFSKTADQSLSLIKHLGTFRSLGCPVLMGPSRKSFLAPHLPPGVPPAERLWGTAAAVTACVLNGADVIRVHDVREMAQVARVANALRNAR